MESVNCRCGFAADAESFSGQENKNGDFESPSFIEVKGYQPATALPSLFGRGFEA